MKEVEEEIDETQGENEGGSRVQWMKHKEEMKGAMRMKEVEGAMDEKKGENEGGSLTPQRKSFMLFPAKRFD